MTAPAAAASARRRRASCGPRRLWCPAEPSVRLTMVTACPAARYRAAFAAGPAQVVDEVPRSRGVYHLAVIRVPDRTRVARDLTAMGIQTGIHYPIPCHRQGPYQRFAAGRPLQSEVVKLVGRRLYPGAQSLAVGDLA